MNVEQLKEFIKANFDKLETGTVKFVDEKGEVTWEYPPQKKE